MEEIRQEREQAVRAAQEQERQLAARRAAQHAAWQRAAAEREQMAAQWEAFEAVQVQVHAQGPLQVTDGDLMVDHADAEYLQVLAEAARAAAAAVAAEARRQHLRDTLTRPCACCLEELPFGDDGRTLVTLRCFHDHQFCATCLHDAWRHDGQRRCPSCRQPATEADVAAVAAGVSRGAACTHHQQLLQQDAARQATWQALQPAPERTPLPPERPPPAQPSRGTWEAIDRYSVLTCVLSPCTHLLDVPSDLRVHWAIARVDVFEELQRARAAQDELQVERALKWHLCLHDVLLRGSRRGTRGGGRMAGVLEGRFARWRAGDRAGLLEEWAADRVRGWQRAERQRARGQHPPRTEEAAAAAEEQRRAETVASALELIEDGELSRALRMLHSLGVAGVSEAVLRQLQAKHPARARLLPESLPTPPQRVTVHLTDTLRTLRRRAGTGPSGERNEYLRALVGHFDDARADRVMQLFDEFASDVASAAMPSWYYAAQSFATLLPIVKKALTRAEVAAGVEPDVRPVAVGEVQMRAILGHVTDGVTSAMADILAPQQVAVGVAGGISILIHGLRVLVEHRGDFVVVRLDLKNAYNAASRSAMLRRFSEHPQLAPRSCHCSMPRWRGLIGWP